MTPARPAQRRACGSRSRSRLKAALAAGALAIAPAQGPAQQPADPPPALSKEDFVKNREAMIRAVAAMEAEQARQRAAAAELETRRNANSATSAERQQAADNSAALAADDPELERAKADDAAREERIRREVPPEVRELLAAQAAPAGRAPAAPGEPSARPGRKPAPAQPERSRKVIIRADGGSSFNSEANLVVFEENVIVNHPQFDLACDRLIVFMKAARRAPEGGTDADGGGAAPEGGGEGEIDKAIATGRSVLIRKRTDTGEVQIGRAEKVTFEADSGDVLLQGSPQAQRGPNLFTARDPSTTMILKSNGDVGADGPLKAEVVAPEGESPAAPDDTP